MFALFGLLILCSFFLGLTQSQFVESLPQCIQGCISQSEDENCSVTDIKCLCRASAGNFLPDLITCMHGNCDNSLDNNLLLTPLQFACEIAGTPIPDSAIQNAEDAGSSLATQVTKTLTVGGSSATGGGFEATTIVNAESSSVSAVTVTTTQGGSSIVIVYPVTEWRTTTMSGSGSAVTSTSDHVSTGTPSSSIASESSDSTTTLTAAQSSSQSSTSTSKTKPPASDETNSAPFKDTNSAARPAREGAGNWLGLTILLAAGIMWF